MGECVALDGQSQNDETGTCAGQGETIEESETPTFAGDKWRRQKQRGGDDVTGEHGDGGGGETGETSRGKHVTGAAYDVENEHSCQQAKKARSEMGRGAGCSEFGGTVGGGGLAGRLPGCPQGEGGCEGQRHEQQGVPYWREMLFCEYGGDSDKGRHHCGQGDDARELVLWEGE